MLNLVSLMDEFQTDADCREILENIRWPNGINCTRCGCVEVLELETTVFDKGNYQEYLTGAVGHLVSLWKSECESNSPANSCLGNFIKTT